MSVISKYVYDEWTYELLNVIPYSFRFSLFDFFDILALDLFSVNPNYSLNVKEENGLSPNPQQSTVSILTYHSVNKLITLFCNQFATTLPKNPVFSGTQSVFLLFKLNRCRWLSGTVIQNSVYTLYLIYDSACYFSKYFPRDLG